MSDDVKIKIGAVNTASVVLAKVSKDLTKFGLMASRVGRQAASAVRSAGSSMTGLGQRMAIVSGIGAYGFSRMVTNFAGFEGMIGRAGVIAGATGSDFEAMRSKAQELGATTAFTATQAAEGMKYLGMAGFDTNQILAGIGSTLSLAAAGGIELGEAADIASDVSSAYGLAADEIGRVADVIAVTATSANTDVSMMGETMKYVASMSRVAGQTIEETSVAIALLGNSGLKASMAGTSLANIYSKLVEKKEQLAKEGISTTDDEGNIRDLMDVMREVGEATKSMTEEKRVAFFFDIFDKRAAKAAAILANATTPEIEKFRRKMSEAGGAADAMASAMLDNLQGTGVLLKSAFDGLSNSIIESIKGPLREYGDQLTIAVQKATKWVAENRQIVQVMIAAAAAFAASSVGLIALGSALSLAGFSLSALITGFGLLSSAVAFLMTPATAIGAGIIAVLATIGISALNSARDVGIFEIGFKAVNETLSEFSDIATRAFSAISEAMATGQWGIAAEIGMAAVELAMWTGLQNMMYALDQALPKMSLAMLNMFSKWGKMAFEAASYVGGLLSNPIQATKNAFNLKDALDGIMNESGPGGAVGLEIWMEKQRQNADYRLKMLESLAASRAKKIREAIDLELAGKSELGQGANALGGGIANLLSDPINAMQTGVAKAQGFATEIYNKAKTQGLGAKIDDFAKAQEEKKLAGPLMEQFQSELAAFYSGPVIARVTGQTEGVDPMAARIDQTLQATQGRLLTRGPGSNPMLETAKKQAKSLEIIAKNTEPKNVPTKAGLEMVPVGPGLDLGGIA